MGQIHSGPMTGRTVLVTGEYPEGIRGFGVSAYRYALRVEAYTGFLTDRYPPFSLAA